LAVISLLSGVFAAIGSHPAPAQADTNPTYGCPATVDGSPVGGGIGYLGTPSGGFQVSTKAQLDAAISAGHKLIELADDAQITLGSRVRYAIPANTTIYSFRGINGGVGGLIYDESVVLGEPGDSAIYGGGGYLKLGKGCKLIGLRIRGADTTKDGMFGDQYNRLRQSGIEMANGCSVENCEVWGWSYSGITGYSGSTSVRFNNIHHNWRNGLGYAVEVGEGAHCLFEANKIDYYRHVVVGVRSTQYATVGVNYEACNNLIGPNGYNHIFDCHGGYTDATYPAGDVILIHHNTSQNTSEPMAGIRGIPITICDSYNNWTYYTGGGSPWKVYCQETMPTSPSSGTPNPVYVRMQQENNWFGTTPPPSSNSAPVLNAVGNKAVVELGTLAFTISATDPDGDILTYSASNLPSGASFDPPTRIFTWTPSQSQVGIYNGIRLQVSDGVMTDYEDITITVSDGAQRAQADVNSDGAVNSLDMIMVGQHWNETGENGWIREDINRDGTVNVLDATLVGQNWTG